MLSFVPVFPIRFVLTLAMVTTLRLLSSSIVFAFRQWIIEIWSQCFYLGHYSNYSPGNNTLIHTTATRS
jgi:hypothetical protein